MDEGNRTRPEPSATGESGTPEAMATLARGLAPQRPGRADARSTPEARLPAATEAHVVAPARLHFGFLDLNYDLGRKFVGLGMAIEAPATVLTLARTDTARAAADTADVSVSGPEAERAGAHLARLVDEHGAASGLRLTIESVIPAHAGLGSGTQLALAVAAAFAALERPAAGADALARELGRAERSGIGFAAFRTGGVILDGGRGPATEVPPVLSRLPVPDAWRILLVFDRAHFGMHGEAEKAAFAALPPFPAEVSAELCRLTLVKALPAVAEGDAGRFGVVVGEIQRRVGDHFAPAQGGRYASPAVSEVIAWLAAQGHAGIGQTSWGPTGFCILGDAATAERLADAARRRYAGDPALDFAVVRGRNEGACIALR